MAITVPLKILDDTEQTYLSRNPKNRYKAMEETLERFKDVDPKGRFLMLLPEDVRDLENLLRDQVPSGKALLTLVKRLVNVSVGGVEVPMVEQQLTAINERAAFHGVEPKVYLERELEKAINHACTGHYSVARV